MLKAYWVNVIFVLGARTKKLLGLEDMHFSLLSKLSKLHFCAFNVPTTYCLHLPLAGHQHISQSLNTPKTLHPHVCFLTTL